MQKESFMVFYVCNLNLSKQISSFSQDLFGANAVQIFAIFQILLYNFVCSTIADVKLIKNHQQSSTKKPCEFGLRNFPMCRQFVGFFFSFCQHFPLHFFPFSSLVSRLLPCPYYYPLMHFGSCQMLYIFLSFRHDFFVQRAQVSSFPGWN